MSETFQPGVERMAREGVRVVRQAYPDGAIGVTLSLQEIARRIREARNDADLRGWSGDVLIRAGKPQTIRAQAQAILDAFRAQTIYAPDPAGTEMINSAAATLCLRPGLCVRARDCDDGVVAVGGALASLGMNVQVLKQSWRGQQEHVLVAVEDEQGKWLVMDPSLDNTPVGYKVPADNEVWMNPLSDSIPNANGTTGAELVGVGAPRQLHWDGAYWWERKNGQLWKHVNGVWNTITSNGVGCPVCARPYGTGSTTLGPRGRGKVCTFCQIDAGRTGFGIIASRHTVSDLQWLLASRDYFFMQVWNKIQAVYSLWRAKDQAVADKWYSEFDAFGKRYAAARKPAQDVLDAAKSDLLPDSINVIDESLWDGVIKAFQQTPMTRSPGDFSDLVFRLAQAGYRVDFPAIPVDKSIDWDLATYQTADTALKAVKEAARLVGKAADDAAKKTFPWVGMLTALGLTAGGLYALFLFGPEVKAMWHAHNAGNRAKR